MKEHKLSALKLTLGAFAVLVAGLLLYQAVLLIMVFWYKVNAPRMTPVMKAQLHSLQTEDPSARLNYQWVPYADISTQLKRAVISAEDANFTRHRGIEWESIRRAWEYNRQQSAQGSSRRQGGSTISQQLAKNLFLSNSRSYLRKAQEVVLTYMIETIMSKERILELYLNVAQWGTHTFGAQAAAQHYYGIKAASLNAEQSARLAAMLPNPAYYDKRRDSPYLHSRTRTIRLRLRQVSLP